MREKRCGSGVGLGVGNGLRERSQVGRGGWAGTQDMLPDPNLECGGRQV